MRLRKKGPASKKWRGQPTLKIRMKDPSKPGKYKSHEHLMVTPVVDKGVPQVHLWYHTGEMVGRRQTGLSTTIIQSGDIQHSDT